MNDYHDELQGTALNDFRTARFQANMEIIRAHLTGRSADLLSYEEVRKTVRARETNKRELKEIPLDAIVGSVGRYKDFTRHFLPRVEEDKDRWARVYSLTDSLEGLPPIEVFQLGAVYFVSDGNHRVSVARSHDSKFIEAFVTYVETDVPIELDLQPNDLIAKERYVKFLGRTHLKDAYPDLDLSMSVAGNYRILEQQIGVHQWWVEEYKKEKITYPAAAVRWFEYIYWPIIQMIRERGMMRDFPDRTETDLYVWIDKHRQELAEELEWSVDAETAAADLIVTKSKRPQRILNRIGNLVSTALTPDVLEVRPESRIWRESLLSSYKDNRLFPRIMVALDGQDNGWRALELALQIAHFERAQLYGLHIVSHKGDKTGEDVKVLKSEFVRRCQKAAVPGELSIEIGKITSMICDRARWTDLVVVSLSHPPGPKPVQRLSSKFRQLLQRSPCPVLTVPHSVTEINKLLLAYDGSPKANEALFLAAYVAKQWQLPLTVVTVLEKQVSEDTTGQAYSYLHGHNIQATFVQQTGDPAQIILDTAKNDDAGLIIMGGYGHNPLIEIAVGSVVDQVLRNSNWPIVVSR